MRLTLHKSICAALCALMCFAFAACSNGVEVLTSEPSPTIDASSSPAVYSDSEGDAVVPDTLDTEDVDAPEDAAPVTQESFEAELTDAVAYYLTDVNKASYYYGALEYKNNSGVDAVVGSIDVTLTFGSKTVTQSFTPPSAELDVVPANGTSTAALWISTKDDAPEEGATIMASATIHLTPAAAPCSRPLTAENLQVIQNYPLFATASGCMENKSDSVDCSLEFMYLSFYDTEDKLLGVTYFSKNLAVPALEQRDFVVHLMSLPVEGLAVNTAKIVSRGFGVS